MDQNLAELIKKKSKAEGPNGPIDWDERRNNYLAAVEGLYQQIAQIFAEPIADNAITLDRRKKDLTENYIGTYSVDDLLLRVGDEQVRFSPRGRNVVGAEGRVDVIGERGEAILVLQQDGGWAIVRSRQPMLQVAPLDEAAFAEMLSLVMRD